MKKWIHLLLALLLAVSLAVPAGASQTEEVSALIGALPTAAELAAMDAEVQSDAYYQTQAAYDAYMALSQEEKARIGGAEETFDALFAHFNAQIMPIEQTEAAQPEQDTLSGAVATALSAVIAIAVLGRLKKKKL